MIRIEYTVKFYKEETPLTAVLEEVEDCIIEAIEETIGSKPIVEWEITDESLENEDQHTG